MTRQKEEPLKLSEIGDVDVLILLDSGAHGERGPLFPTTVYSIHIPKMDHFYSKKGVIGSDGLYHFQQRDVYLDGPLLF